MGSLCGDEELVCFEISPLDPSTLEERMDRPGPNAPRSQCRERRVRSLLALGLVLTWLVGLAGCEGLKAPSVKLPTLKLPKLLGGGAGANGVNQGGEVEVIAFGDWTRDSLHCAADHCQNFYGVIVEQAGTLKAEVYAPWGSNMPDFDLALLDADGNPLARPSKPNGRPRRLTHRLLPGSYYLRVHSRGNSDTRLKYDIVTSLSTDVRAPKKPRVASKPPRPKPTPKTARKPKQPETAPVSTAAPKRDVLVTAEVLDVDEVDGAAAFVLLDAGEPQRVEEDMQGELREGGQAIGQIVIVEVYADGSRARVIGDLSGEVGIDTQADIFH